MFKKILVFLLLLVSSTFMADISAGEIIWNKRIYTVDKAIDLNGETLVLPEGGRIVFTPSGSISNGTVIGRNTRIKKETDNCFGVILQGTWRVKNIKDVWFDQSNLSDNQILDNLMVLQRDDMKQKVVVERDYVVELSDKRPTALSVFSNTNFLLKSTISIKGNNLQRYNIVSIAKRENVKFTGGVLRGDVGTHQYVAGSTSEWGFALFISQSTNVVVTDVTTTLCTGDGIYISGGEEKGIGLYGTASRNIVLKRCILDDLRREGISLVHADGVLIEDCKAVNMGRSEYTPPSFGIDIEPNKNKAVRNVVVRRFVTENTRAEYSFATSGYQFDGVRYNRENVILDHCVFDKGLAVMSGGITIKNSTMKKVAIYTSNVPANEDGIVIFENCTIAGGNGIQFDGRKVMDSSKPRPSYLFRNCTISAANIYSPIPGLIWGTDLDKINAELIFERCRITLQSGLKGNRLFANGLKLDSEFKWCELYLGEYDINSTMAVFVGCSIERK